MAIENKRMFQLVDTSTNWAGNNPILGSGELAYASDNGVLKVGDGSTRYIDLGVLAVVAAGLDNLDGVTITNPTNGQLLVFNSSTDQWENQDFTQATETIVGGATIATQAEVDAGTRDDVMITPAKLGGSFNSVSGQGLDFDGSLLNIDLADTSALKFDGVTPNGKLQVSISTLSFSNTVGEDAFILYQDATTGILTATNKQSLLGGLNQATVYRGTWDANSNVVTGDSFNATLVASTAPNTPIGEDPTGYTYTVDTAGTFDLGFGSTAFSVGDQVVWSGTQWTLIPATASSVASVFGRTGAVIAQANDYTASLITLNPTGGITATDVQSGFAEIDSTKADQSIILTAGNGLIGGGTISGNVTFNVVAGTNVVVSANDVSVPNSSEGTRGAAAIATQSEVTTGTNDSDFITPLKFRVGLQNTSINILSDVDTQTITPSLNQVLTWNGSEWIPQDQTGGGGSSTLAGLLDTEIVSPTDGQILVYNGSTNKWDNSSSIPPPTINLSDLNDVVLTGAADLQALIYDSGSNQWVNQDIPRSIAALSDVDITGITIGQILRWNGAQFEPITLIGSINDLTDVDTSTVAPTINQALIWDGVSDWRPGTVSFVSTIDDLSDVDTSTSSPNTNDVLTWDGFDWIPQPVGVTGDATETVKGVVRIATQAEVDAGVLDDPIAVTPLKLQNKIATETARGILEIADAAEMAIGADDSTAVSPFKFRSTIATETAAGTIEIATTAEVDAGTNDTNAITPAKLVGRVASETATGLIEIATQTETDAGVLDDRAITPLKMETRIQARAGDGIRYTSGEGYNVDLVDSNSGLNMIGSAGSRELFVDIVGTQSTASATGSDVILVHDGVGLRSITKDNFLGSLSTAIKIRGTFTPGTPSATVSNVTGDPLNATISQGVAPTGGSPDGFAYLADTAANSDLTGTTEAYVVNDLIFWSGSQWVRVGQASSVVSIFGRTGVVIAQANDYTAALIQNTPSGTITATDAQGAIDQLETNKVPSTRNVNTGNGVAGGGSLSGDLNITAVGGNNVTVDGSGINVADATETVSGVLEVATQSETTSGTADNKIVTPLKLEQKLSSFNTIGFVYPSSDVHVLTAEDVGKTIVFDESTLAEIQIPDGLDLGHNFSAVNVGGGGVQISPTGTDTTRGVSSLQDLQSFMSVLKITGSIWQTSER